MDVRKKRDSLTQILVLVHETTALTLGQILPMIAHHKLLTDQYNMIDSLKELTMDGSPDEILTDEHRYVLDHAESIREQYKQTPVHLNRLCSEWSQMLVLVTLDDHLGMVVDLFIDKHKFEGTNVKAKIPALFDKLNASYSQPQAFIDFFNSL